MSVQGLFSPAFELVIEASDCAELLRFDSSSALLDLDLNEDLDADADLDAGEDADPDTDVNTGPDADADPDAGADADADPNAGADAHTDPDADADADPDSDANARPYADNDVDVEADTTLVSKTVPFLSSLKEDASSSSFLFLESISLPMSLQCPSDARSADAETDERIESDESTDVADVARVVEGTVAAQTDAPAIAVVVTAAPRDASDALEIDEVIALDTVRADNEVETVCEDETVAVGVRATTGTTSGSPLDEDVAVVGDIWKIVELDATSPAVATLESFASATPPAAVEIVVVVTPAEDVEKIGLVELSCWIELIHQDSPRVSRALLKAKALSIADSPPIIGLAKSAKTCSPTSILL